MMPEAIPEVARIILRLIDASGGSYVGTLNLCQEIPATEDGVLRSLRRCRERRLIKSIHSHGGRGHKAIHRLTAKGRREAGYVLTQKGKDHVCSH
jgi:hypothetical protein